MNNQFTNELENENGFENENENENGNELEMKIGNETKAGNELEMNSTIEFEATFKQETIRGFLDMNYVDDETPLQFYDINNQLQWYIPKNPNDKELQQELWNDYDYLKTVFQEHYIVDLLCEYHNESKTIVLEETVDGELVLLKINDGDDE